MAAKRFRKKPVEIEAVQWDGSLTRIMEIDEWIGQPFDNRTVNWRADDERGVDRVVIHTLEGEMQVSVGDWIIRGVKGEFYPCKPDIFELTYEEA